MRMIAHVLDNVHTLAKEVEKSTRRKKKLQREHLIGAFHVARILASGLAAVLPKAVPISVVLNSLNDCITPQKTVTEGPEPDDSI